MQDSPGPQAARLRLRRHDLRESSTPRRTPRTARECDNVPVPVERIGRLVAPGPLPQWRQFACSSRQRSGMMTARIIHDKVQLAARYSPRRSGIGQCGPKQRPDSGLRHQSKHCPLSQRELGHSGDVERRGITKHRSPEGGRGDLVGNIHDEVRLARPCQRPRRVSRERWPTEQPTCRWSASALDTTPSIGLADPGRAAAPSGGPQEPTQVGGVPETAYRTTARSDPGGGPAGTSPQPSPGSRPGHSTPQGSARAMPGRTGPMAVGRGNLWHMRHWASPSQISAAGRTTASSYAEGC